MYSCIQRLAVTATPWRNGSASDSRSEGCVFKSRRGHSFLFFGFSLFLFCASLLCVLWGDHYYFGFSFLCFLLCVLHSSISFRSV